MPTRDRFVTVVVVAVVVVVGGAAMAHPALAQPGQQACSNPTQTSNPQAAALRNDVDARRW